MKFPFLLVEECLSLLTLKPGSQAFVHCHFVFYSNLDRFPFSLLAQYRVFVLSISFQSKFDTAVETTQKNKREIVTEDQTLIGSLINATAEVLNKIVNAREMARNFSTFAEENKAPDIFRTHILQVRFC